MNTVSVRVSYRPIRLAWCIEEGSLEQFRKAIRLSSTLWGGRFNPIIPLGSNNVGELDKLLETFNVDVLFALSKATPVAQFVQRAHHLPWLDLHERSLFVQDADGALPVLLDVYHPVRKLAEGREKREVTPGLLPSLLTRPKLEGDPLDNILLATLGDYPDGDYCPIDYGRFVDRLLGTNYLWLGREAELPNDYWSRLTPLVVTEQDLLVYKRRGGWDTPGVFIGDPGSFSDLVTFWNLRAADIGVIFLPESGGQRLLPATRGWLEKVQKHLETRGQSIKVPALWCTRQKDWTPYKTILNAGYSLHCVSDGTWNELNIRAPRAHFESHSVLGTVDEGQGRISVSFPLPMKPFLEAEETQHQHAIASVRPVIDPEPTLGTFRLPYIPRLNEFYGKKTRYDHSSARIEADALGAVVELHRSHLQLQGIPTLELLAEVFQLAGITAKQSSAGKISLRVIQHMGGLDNCRVFKIRGVRNLLHEFTASKSFTHGQALARIGSGFEPYKRLFIEPRDERDLEPQDVFLHLVRKKILRTGVELRCPNCGLPEWYSINDLSENVTCAFCGANIESGPQLRDGLWHYRVSGLFTRTRDQEGAIPVTLALMQALRCLEMRGMTWLTGMDLTWSDSGKEAQAETDLVVLTQNYESEPQILLGECKTNTEVDEDQIERLLLAAKRCTDSGVKAFAMFAKAGCPFTPKELELIDAHQTIDLNFILLTPTELEPYLPYENVKSDKIRSGWPHTIEDWAETSRVLYLKTKPAEILDRHLKATK